MERDKAGFTVLTAGYLAATTAESLLAPVFPQAGKQLGMGTGAAGVTFAILSAAISVGGIVGGFVLTRLGPRVGVVLSLLLVSAGTFGAAAAHRPVTFVAAHVALGGGSGLFFAPGIRSAALLAGERRRGLAMALFGVAFSGGLALAGALAALGAVWGWRTSYVATAVFAAAAALALAFTPVPSPPAARRERARRHVRAALATPLRVGSVAAISQYGTIAFVPIFAVHVWGLSAATAALVLTIARIASVPAKLLSGNALDGAGALQIARRLGLLLAALGAWWTLVPGAAAAAWAAIAFVAFVSGLAPVANVLALDSFEEHGELLGAFRSAQIGFGAAASALLGAGAATIGLRPSLIVAAVLVPASLVRFRRRGEPQAGTSAPSLPS
jgi:predicted MFS family arabinose efflux permease